MELITKEWIIVEDESKESALRKAEEALHKEHRMPVETAVKYYRGERRSDGAGLGDVYIPSHWRVEVKTRPAEPGEYAAPLEEPEIPSLGLSVLAFSEVKSRLRLAQLIVSGETDEIRLQEFSARHVDWASLRPWAERYLRWMEATSSSITG